MSRQLKKTKNNGHCGCVMGWLNRKWKMDDSFSVCYRQQVDMMFNIIARTVAYSEYIPFNPRSVLCCSAVHIDICMLYWKYTLSSGSYSVKATLFIMALPRSTCIHYTITKTSLLPPVYSALEHVALYRGLSKLCLYKENMIVSPLTNQLQRLFASWQ